MAEVAESVTNTKTRLTNNQEPESGNLKRKLDSRLLNMIAIGGSIGTGIFLASGNAIHMAGPGGTLVAYFVTAVMVYFLMTSLCEMAAFMPTTGSFYFYASRFVDPALGYALGWNYWYNWAITVASEISAASIVMQFWFPNSDPFIWSALFIAIFIACNAFSARGFGEIEYWFSVIKVTTIIVFIFAGFAMVFGFTQHEALGIKNWMVGSGPFQGGGLAIFSAFIVAGFSFQGTELIGIAAGETKSPEISIPKAIKQVFWRILLFFLLSIVVISLLIPHTQTYLAEANVNVSPFTFVFKELGIVFAASLVNAVILTAILSAGNSGMYAATRMLWILAKNGHVPAIFGRLSKRGVPVYALVATTAVAMLTFLSSLFGNGKIYFWLLSASSLSGFIAWLGIAISHYRFRKAYLKQGLDLKKLPYVAKGYPYAPLFAFTLCLVIIGGQNIRALLENDINWFEIAISYIGVPIFLALWLGYKFFRGTKVVKLEDCDFNSLNKSCD